MSKEGSNKDAQLKVAYDQLVRGTNYANCKSKLRHPNWLISELKYMNSSFDKLEEMRKIRYQGFIILGHKYVSEVYA